MSKKKNPNGKKGPPRKPKPLTRRQSLFAKAFAKSKSVHDAAIAAGLSPKNPDQSGYQMLEALRKKRVPEICNALGFGMPEIIQKHLGPKLFAKETKFAQEDGEFTDYVEVDALDIQDRAIDKFLRLHGAYAPKDPEAAAQVGVKVIIMDMPRPQMDLVMDDVRPGPLPAHVKKPNGSGNGTK